MQLRGVSNFVDMPLTPCDLVAFPSVQFTHIDRENI